MNLQVTAIPDEEMPEGREWAVVNDGDRVLMLVRASTVTRSAESQRLLNAALAAAASVGAATALTLAMHLAH